MNQRGFSLSELMMATGIMTTSFLVLTLLAVLAWQQYMYVVSKTDAESNAARLEYYFRSVLGQATDIKNPNPALCGTTGICGLNPVSNTFDITVFNSMDPVVGNGQPTGGNGYIAQDFNYSSLAVTPVWTTLGVFLRERGGTTSDAGVQDYGGNLSRTAIYFRRPEPATAAAVSTSGVVFFDMGIPDPLNPAAPMSPDYSDIFVPGVTELSFESSGLVNVSEEPRLTTVRIRFKIRYFFVGTGLRIFCPSADVSAAVAGCTGSVNYADVDRTFDVSIRNNVMKHRGVVPVTGSQGTNPEVRVSGNIHFFQIVNPLQLGTL